MINTKRLELPNIKSVERVEKANNYGLGSNYIQHPSKFSGLYGMSTGLNILWINNIQLNQKKKQKVKEIY